MVRVSFHPEATAELEKSTDWYMERSPIAARELCVAIDLALTNIADDPGRFPRLDANLRAGNVSGFPFQIVFCRDQDRIHVIAIAHAKRRPN
jgi:toxin ParE1/3/4